MRLATDFEEIPEYESRWGLAFVDHEISERRGHSVEQLKGKADVIIAHDTCHFYLYGYYPVIKNFKYRWDWVLLGPRTSVLSDDIDVSTIMARMCL